MRNFSKIIAAVCCIAKLHAQDLCEPLESFFMSAEESEKIIKLLSKERKNCAADKAKHNVRISGIFYVSDNDWTIWINGAPYSTIGQHEDFSIDAVSPNAVSLTFPDGETRTLSVTVD